MTEQEAFEQQLIVQIGSACLTIAKQAGAITALRAEVEKKNEELKTLKLEEK